MALRCLAVGPGRDRPSAQQEQEQEQGRGQEQAQEQEQERRQGEDSEGWEATEIEKQMVVVMAQHARCAAELKALQGGMEHRVVDSEGWGATGQGGQMEAQYEAAMGQPRQGTDEKAQVIDITKVVAEQKARNMVAAEEEARQRGCRKERCRQERRRQAAQEQERRRQAAQERLEASRRDRAKILELPWSYLGATQEQERRRKPMDVLNVLDVSAKENNMVVKKHSKKTMDKAKEENGERMIK